MTFPTNTESDGPHFRFLTRRDQRFFPPYRQSATEKEQIKALASFLNLIGVGFITVGVIAPAIGILREIITGEGLDLDRSQMLQIASLLAASAAGGMLFRVASHRAFIALQDNLNEVGDVS
ncbi:hypothetical protein E3C22_21370 [Jiella endophytica]|uniref:Uncharacterized protein n=1 Tax=Jiella endophytica TaxID=2558362 RepID=A0A4Y8RB43_9HYPH|nr:hypothetical protein [Jiella endophytica]TFF18773.1 hypothetical protein E3C22_21370 [Jiella endophytica]